MIAWITASVILLGIGALALYENKKFKKSSSD